MTTTRTTWEEAATQVLYPVESFKRPEDPERLLADYTAHARDDLPADGSYFDYIGLADEALTHLFHLSFAPDLASTLAHDREGYVVKSYKRELVDLWASKQRDYGHGNITAYGELGVQVRISDKLNRLVNLAKRDNPSNESVKDSWTDVLGYCVIGMMLRAGTFTLPLAEDAAAEAAPTGTDILTGPRHDPVYAAKSTPITAAGWANDGADWKRHDVQPPRRISHVIYIDPEHANFPWTINVPRAWLVDNHPIFNSTGIGWGFRFGGDNDDR